MGISLVVFHHRQTPGFLIVRNFQEFDILLKHLRGTPGTLTQRRSDGIHGDSRSNGFEL